MTNRRTFLKQTATLAALGTGWRTIEGAAQGAPPQEKTQRSGNREPIGYIRKEIPKFDLPAYPGTRYEVLAPDTLDWQERATLAVNVLTRATDPEADYELYFNSDFRRNPPLMDHNFNGICDCKFMEALPLMRLVSGSRENLDVDRVWREVALRNLGPDGIYYYPLRGRPWALLGPWLALQGLSEDKIAKIRASEQMIVPLRGGRMLSAMMNYARVDNAALWKQEAQRLANGLVTLAVDRGNHAFFAPSNLYVEKGCREAMGWVPQDAWVALGLVHLYRETGYKPAITLARKLLNNIVVELKFFSPDGTFGPATDKAWHFHTHTYVLLAVLGYALATGDQDMLELARRGFEYGKANGNVLLGYFPEMFGPGWPHFATSELCEVADMIALGIKLSAAGVGDYWDDVDRWARNMFAEGQLTPERAARLERYVASLPVKPVDKDTILSGQNVQVSGYQTTDRVIERNIGGFAGWPAPNDWGLAFMHCCTGNSARSIYYLWDSILTRANGRLRVNLLFNRAADWADVDSYLPYEGRVDVKIKKATELSVRIPDWVKPVEVRCRVNDADRPLSWEGRYAVAGKVQPNDVATLTFPIFERTDKVRIQGKEYTLIRKGNDVVHIDPPGKYCPLYQREKYRENKARTKKVERFVAQQELHW